MNPRAVIPQKWGLGVCFVIRDVYDLYLIGIASNPEQFCLQTGAAALSHHTYSVVDELRSWVRFCKDPDTDFAVILHPDLDELLAEVHDESLGGIGLLLDDATQFPVGKEVEIVYAGELMLSYVRHIEPYPDDRFLVGFQCDR